MATKYGLSSWAVVTVPAKRDGRVARRVCLLSVDSWGSRRHRFVCLLTKERHIDISKDARALQKLRKEAERARRELSSKSSAVLEVDAITNGDDFQDTLTRQAPAAVRRHLQEGGGIAWRRHVAAACDRRRGVGKGGRRYDGGPRTCIHRRRYHGSL